ncbi:MAG TPA: carbohydrate ABC transporter permease [Chloroflexota bacterium]
MRRRRHSPLAIVGAILSYLAMTLAIIVMGLPLLWMATSSVKTLPQVYSFPPVWLPLPPQWANYIAAWHAAPFGRFYINSIVNTGIGASIKLANAVLTAYALSFLRIPFRNALFIVMLCALMVPPEIAILPNYLTVARLHWVNTYAGLIAPSAGVAFVTFLLRQTFLSLPREVLEAATVDGAGHGGMLWQVVLPMARPSLATAALLLMEAKWNEFLWPLIVTNAQNMRTLPVGLAFLAEQETVTQWQIVMAGTVLVILPVLIAFLLVQRQLVQGITAGAIKG